MGRREAVVRCLADGRIHSGREVAARLGVSRSAVWKHIRRLGEWGVEVQAVPGRGYRLTQALELLDRARILEQLDAPTASALEALNVLGVTDSTSTRVLALPAPSPGQLRACCAEFQTSGRGRRGRRWLSPYASGLCLSVSWCFETVPADLPALSLAAGLAVRRGLSASREAHLMLKWPNDVVRDGAKLAGILVDVEGESSGPLRAAVGVGVNVTVPPALAAGIVRDGGMPPVGLDTALPAGHPGRNEMAARLLNALFAVFAQFSRHGFAPFADEWRRYDYLFGKPVTVRAGSTSYAGTAAGISAAGALLLDNGADIATVIAGDVSLRQAA